MKEQLPVETTKEIALIAVNDMCEEGIDTSFILNDVVNIVSK